MDLDIIFTVWRTNKNNGRKLQQHRINTKKKKKKKKKKKATKILNIV